MHITKKIVQQQIWWYYNSYPYLTLNMVIFYYLSEQISQSFEYFGNNISFFPALSEFIGYKGWKVE